MKGRRGNVNPAALACAAPLAQDKCPPETFLVVVLGGNLRAIPATEPGDVTLREIATIRIYDSTGEPWPDS